MNGLENENVREQAALLWQEAFGDSREYIEFFFDTHRACRALTMMSGSTLTSMLFLIDGEMLINGERLPAFYLFAACTFKRFRGRGLMAQLLKNAESFSAEQGREYIALVPAESSLFDYYGRFGYKTAFYCEKIPADCYELIKNNADRFNWSEAHRDYVRAEQARFGGTLIEADGEIFTVSDSMIKAPSPTRAQRYGMLLPLTKRAESIFPDNAYIGLTLE